MFQSVSCSSPPTRTRQCFWYCLHEKIFLFPYISTGKSLLPSKIQDTFYKGRVSQCSLYPWSFGIKEEITKLSPYSFKKCLRSALITGVQHHDALSCAQLRELISKPFRCCYDGWRPPRGSHYKPGPGCGGGNVAGSLRGVKNGRLLLAPPTAVTSCLICSHHHEVCTSAEPPWCHILIPPEP